jgi:hypothetical protein
LLEVQAPFDAPAVGFDNQANALVHGNRQPLRTAHLTQASRHHQLTL